MKGKKYIWQAFALFILLLLYATSESKYEQGGESQDFPDETKQYQLVADHNTSCCDANRVELFYSVLTSTAKGGTSEFRSRLQEHIFYFYKIMEKAIQYNAPAAKNEVPVYFGYIVPVLHEKYNIFLRVLLI